MRMRLKAARSLHRRVERLEWWLDDLIDRLIAPGPEPAPEPFSYSSAISDPCPACGWRVNVPYVNGYPEAKARALGLAASVLAGHTCTVAA